MFFVQLSSKSQRFGGVEVKPPGAPSLWERSWLGHLRDRSVLPTFSPLLNAVKMAEFRLLIKNSL